MTDTNLSPVPSNDRRGRPSEERPVISADPDLSSASSSETLNTTTPSDASPESRRRDDLARAANRVVLEYLDDSQNQTTSLGLEAWLREHDHYHQMMEWREEQMRRERDLWERYEEAESEALQVALPPNWKSPDIELPDLEQLSALQLVEGIPLAWVPPNRVLRGMLECKTAASRRRLIARESSAILKACQAELRRLGSPETSDWRVSAREAASAMKSGHWRAGQALAAIALDTATSKFVRSSYSAATRHFDRNRKPTPPGSSNDSLPSWFEVDYPRAMLVLHSIYGAFSVFDGKGGESAVPVQFTRHATVHTMSGRQYNKSNALIALMHLVGLLCLVEDAPTS